MSGSVVGGWSRRRTERGWINSVCFSCNYILVLLIVPRKITDIIYSRLFIGYLTNGVWLLLFVR